MIVDRDNDIDECKRKIDEQSSDFAAKLKTKLLELQERFDMAGRSYDTDGNSDVTMMRKLDDIAAATRL